MNSAVLAPEAAVSASEALFARARKVMPGGVSRNTVLCRPHPFYVERGEGCYVTDIEGVRRIDFSNNLTSQIHGHAHPAIVAAVTDQLARGTAFSEMVVRRRQAAGDLPTRHHVCAGAGHHVHYPYLPATLISKPHAMSGLLLDGGGTPAANAAGNEASYRAVLAFLDEAIAANGPTAAS